MPKRDAASKESKDGAMMHMEPWKIIDKLQRPDPWADGTHLVLVVEKGGQKKEVTVTGFTWDRAEVGKEVELPR